MAEEKTSVGTIQLDVEINQNSLNAEMNKLARTINGSFKNMFNGFIGQTSNFIMKSINGMFSGFKNIGQASADSSSKASKSINKLNNEYEKTQQKINEIRNELAELRAERDEIIMGYLEKPPLSGMTKEETLEQLLRTDPRFNELSAQIDKLETKLGPLVEKNRQLAEEMSKVGNESKNIRNQMSNMGNSAKKATKSILGLTLFKRIFNREAKRATQTTSNFGRTLNRVSRIIARNLIVYGLIIKGLRGMISYTWSALKTNKQFLHSLNIIKTNLRVAFQPIYDYVLPTINNFMQAMSKITAYIAVFINALFGKTYTQSLKAAQGLEKAKNAMVGLGKAAKAVRGALAGFDEINVLDIVNNNGDIVSGILDPEVIKATENTLEEVATKAEEFAKRVREVLSPLEPLFKGFREVFGSFWNKLKEFKETYLEKWLEKIGNWIKNNPDTLEKLGKGLGIVAAGLASFKALKWLSDVTGVSKLIEKLLELMGVTKKVNKGFEDKNILLGEQTEQTEEDTESAHRFALAMEYALVEVKKFSEYLKKNPIELPRLEIPVPSFVSALNAIEQFNKSVVTNASETGNLVKDFVKDIISVIETNLNTFKENLGKVALNTGYIYAVNLSKGFTTVGNFINQSIEVMQSNLQNFGKNVGVYSGEIAKNFNENLGRGFSAVNINFVTFANALGQSIVGFGKSFLMASAEIAQNFASNMINSFTNVWDNFKGLMKAMGEKVKGWFSANKEIILKTTITAGVVLGAGALALTAPSIAPYAVGALGGLISIPALARGGIVDKPTIAMIGEKGKEAVVPLENTPFITAIANAITGALSGISNQSDRPLEVNLIVDGDRLGRIVINSIKSLQKQEGQILL